MSGEASSALSYPQRTISDEFRELQHIVSQFQTQLDAPHGTVGLHPFGPVNVDGAQTSFTQACKRLREALTSYRDTTLVSWSRLLSSDSRQLSAGQPIGMNESLAVALTNKAPSTVRELDEMRRIADALHEDTNKCKGVLLDAAADAISKALAVTGPTGQQAMLLVERLKSTAKILGLAHYTDVRTEDGGGGGDGTITTVTLAGTIIVIDVDIGAHVEALKVKVSYVSDIEHDERIDALMLDRLRAGDVRGFEELVAEMAELDRLTRTQSPASFIHNTFAVVATLAEIQAQELAALDGDFKQLLQYGSGIAVPHARHVGPSSLYFMPATLRHGLANEDWESLVKEHLLNDRTKSVAELCHWLYYSWETSSKPHCFLPAAHQKYCLAADAMLEDSESHHTVTIRHPGIQGLDMRFLEFLPPRQTDGASDGGGDAAGVWIPYSLVARVEPPLPASALTVRAIMAATALDAAVAPESNQVVAVTHDSPRLLENAPTLENLVRNSTDLAASDPAVAATHADTGVAAPTSTAVHSIAGQRVAVEMEAPQIRAWTVCRIPVHHPQNILAVTAILRRQATFNSLLASCTTTSLANDSSPELLPAIANVTTRTYANDPFRIDLLVKGNECDSDGDTKIEDSQRADQGVVLRVAETSGDILAWTHQSLGITSTVDLLTTMAGVAKSALNESAAHAALSKVAGISNSIPIIALWLSSHPQ
ncbi:hypothetical protein GGI21_003491 [Coemansia aciculifera]|nr:hypothetical protein GGI21_003491 [Coemansia aciculifera]